MTAHEDRPDSDWTDAESEGQLDLEEQRPGIDSETADEGRFLPRDAPIAAEEVGITSHDESIPETLRERVARERPTWHRPPKKVNPGC